MTRISTTDFTTSGIPLSRVNASLISNLLRQWGPVAAGAVLKLTHRAIDNDNGTSPSSVLVNAVVNTHWDEYFRSGRFTVKNQSENPWNSITNEAFTQEDFKLYFESWMKQRLKAPSPYTSLIMNSKIQREKEELEELQKKYEEEIEIKQKREEIEAWKQADARYFKEKKDREEAVLEAMKNSKNIATSVLENISSQNSKVADMIKERTSTLYSL